MLTNLQQPLSLIDIRRYNIRRYIPPDGTHPLTTYSDGSMSSTSSPPPKMTPAPPSRRPSQNTAMRPFGLPANPRPQSRPLTQVVTHTTLPTRSLSSLSRANAITRGHTTDAVTPSSDEPSKDPNAVIRDFPATIEFFYEEDTEEDAGFTNGGNEDKTTETSCSVLASPGSISQGHPTSTLKDEPSTGLRRVDRPRTPHESAPGIPPPPRVNGSGLSKRHALNNTTPPDRVLSALLPLCDFCKRPVSTGGNDVTSFLRNLYQPENASTQFHPAPNHSILCCSTPVCNHCFAKDITVRITSDFWFDLDTEYWARCLSSSCSSRSKFSVGDTLPVTPPGILSHIERYARAMAYRDALQQLTPSPAESALRRAAELHEHLIHHGRMKDPMDPREPLRTEIKVLPVDSADGSQTLQVPIFVEWIVPDPASSRECILCAEAFPDVANGVIETRWEKDALGFPGDWKYLVRPFMSTTALPSCSAIHTLDTCRNCLSLHIEAELKKGRRDVLSITCPDPICSHVYTQEEVRRILNNPEAFARYVKLQLLSSLAALPNFRWCLRKGCEFGQEHVFPTPALPSFPTELDLTQSQRVFCDECGFAMCFAHQTPWHQGVDCIEFGYGGEPLAASLAWLRENTKDCPRCHVPVERRAGCFHMTCSLCRYEFCWLCLADWSGIFTEHPVTHVTSYSRAGHKAGCYFRRDDAPSAFMIQGATLEEALMGVIQDMD